MQRGTRHRRGPLLKRATAVIATPMLLVGLGLPIVAAPAQATLPQGVVNDPSFRVRASDLAFILKQIKIAEAHVQNTTSATGLCGALVGSGPNQVPDVLAPLGLRTVDGSCNNLVPGQEKFGTADQLFPRLTVPTFRDAEAVPPGFPPVFGPAGSPTSYKQKSGFVFDSHPRQISNLIVDQTSTNPAAVAAAGQTGSPGETLFIPNVPSVEDPSQYNSMFTLFGQFVDHGLDQTLKGGGSVFVPLKSDDPLRTVGRDGIPGTGDEVPANKAFMVLTRALNQPGPNGIMGDADDVQDTVNSDSPFVDQSQTYSSHPSHQVFLRKYVNNTHGLPVSTGGLLTGPAGPTAGGMSTWADLKKQSKELLGLELVDQDVFSVPMMAADAYGKFIPGPQRGLPQYVTATGLVEGNIGAPVPVPGNVLTFNTPFLTDIAHNAAPNPGLVADPPDDGASADFASQPAGTYDDEMLNAHFMAGDGRANENIGLVTVHQAFHSEHNRLLEDIKNTLTNDTSGSGAAALAEWKLADGADGWNGERLFQAARFVTEMEYQHITFQEFARKISPDIPQFDEYDPSINAAIKAEFANAVYRFGHSLLDETIARTNADGSDNSIPLLNGFLNPPAFTDGGSAGPLTPREAAGSIVMGMSQQLGNDLDEFVTDTLRNNLVGLPLDLASLNITRGRDIGIPRLNEVRRQFSLLTGDDRLTPYTSWADFGQGIRHPGSLINFVAAYGTFPTITSETTFAGKRAAAKAIVNSPTAEQLNFMNSTGAWATQETGLNNVDLWVGGLAEKRDPSGGLLGTTFNFVFETQLTELQNGDRFYYLLRTHDINLRSALRNDSFAALFMRNTNAQNLPERVLDIEGAEEEEPVTVFSDVPPSHQFFEEISWLADRGITTGFPDGTFRPLDSVSRAAMAAFMFRFSGSPEFTPPAVSPFADLPTNHMFYKEITWLLQSGITTGFPDGTFHPELAVNRKDMAAFLFRLADKPDFTAPAVSPFSDMTPSSQFFLEVSWLAQSGITTGFPDGTFHPFEPVHRDATAAFLFRFNNEFGPPVP
ncbi:peroxidase family protein [Arthrobacter cavernae]|uniref:S-layer homology domain-containing protein n=1 Tax=Arthrobacter cavernae TaxID=2817681 RepID=A0A939HJJ0_9MICC|nr:peroxidase family protein [Arthrobacter cavernae]MBO1269182.1 S-layer homology domain-containing protein [Arthrobacter cavernae]